MNNADSKMDHLNVMKSEKEKNITDLNKDLLSLR